MANKGRKNRYLTEIKPRFDEIREVLKLGVNDKELAAFLDIAPQTLCDYKNRYPEFREFITKCRKIPVYQLKRALFKRATGFDYSEKKVIKRADGTVEETIITKHALPDPASALILLKHWAKDEGWTHDPATLELKKQEFEWKKQQVERGEW